MSKLFAALARLQLKRTARFLIAGCSLAVASPSLAAKLETSAAAHSPPSILSQWKHARWTEDEGGPARASDVIQAGDGFLYLSEKGSLLRSDGISFEKPPFISTNNPHYSGLSKLFVDRGGDLWIGLQQKGVSVVRQGRLQDTAMPTPPPQINELVQMPNGDIWAAYGGGVRRLWRYSGGQWRRMDEELHLPEGFITSLAAGPDGRLWLALLSSDGKHNTLLSVASGAHAVESNPDRLDSARLAFDPHGRLWSVDRLGIRMLRDAGGRVPKIQTTYALGAPIKLATIAFDQSGALWATSRASGVFRLAAAAEDQPKPAPVERFTEADGLTSDITNEVSVDREGDVWVATEGGLDRFRRTSVTSALSIPPDNLAGLGMAKTNSGVVYIVSAGKLFEIKPHAAPRQISAALGEQRVLCGAKDDGVWLVGVGKATRYSNGRWQVLKHPVPSGVPILCEEDRAGRLWVSMSSRMIWYDGGGWHELGGLSKDAEIWDAAIDPNGDLVFTANDKSVISVHGTQLATYNTSALGCPSITSIVAGLRDVFINGCNLVRLRDGKLTSLDRERAPSSYALRALVQTPAGETYMLGQGGLARYSTKALDHAFDDPGVVIAPKLFSAKDGLRSPLQHVGFRGEQGVVGGDGRLWFLTNVGAVFVDPATIPVNRAPPPTVIKSVATHDKTYFDLNNLVLPAGSSAIDIAYAGLSLTMPERVQFRYRLDGVDRDWVDPGSRRLAQYTNLGPGRYAFHVIAANNDGVWNKAGASTAFRIRPTFLQSWLFKALCLMMAAGLLWLAYSVRLRMATSRVRLALEERLHERERIARELHDTLLQGVHGLVLRFQLAAQEWPAGSPARGRLEDALDRADEVIAESRDRVRSLRPQEERRPLEQVIAETAERYGASPSPLCQVATQGLSRPIDSVVQDEVAKIVGEALSNVAQHAKAQTVEVTVTYGAWGLQVCIADDGVGIDQEILKAGRRDGHYGLQGMRERARAINGDLTIEQSAQGVRVNLRVPAAIAYSESDDSAGRDWEASSSRNR